MIKIIMIKCKKKNQVVKWVIKILLSHYHKDFRLNKQRDKININLVFQWLKITKTKLLLEFLLYHQIKNYNHKNLFQIKVINYRK